MSKRLSVPLIVLLIASLVASACVAPAAPTTPAATTAPAAATTAVPATAGPEPTAAVAELDLAVPLEAFVGGLNKDNGYNAVAAAKLAEELAEKPPFLLDVRDPAELDKDGYIEGAVALPLRTLLPNLDRLPGPHEPIVVYCASGHRGALATASLKLLGYHNVRNLAGGLGAWKKAELPVVTGTAPAEPAVLTAAPAADPALLALLADYLTGLPDHFGTVKADALNAELADKPPFLLDVRRAEEWQQLGYLEGATNIPVEELFARLGELPAKDEPIVVYCMSGHRAGLVTMALQLLGYENVRNLAGGFNGWKAAQLPIAGAVDWPAVWSDFLAGLPADQGYFTVKPDVLNGELAEKAPFVIDLRGASEIEQTGYIAGAGPIPLRELLQNLDRLPAQDEPIVVYCVSGHRGALATAALRLLGYSNVRNLAGGMNAWTKGEFATEAGLPAALPAGQAPAVDPIRLRDLDAFLTGLPDNFGAVKAPDLNVELAGGELVIVDLRTPAELAEGGLIEGAVNIPVTELGARLSELPAKDAPIVVYCKSGHRGGMAFMALRMLGYTNVRNLAGGMGAWTAAGLPVVMP